MITLTLYGQPTSTYQYAKMQVVSAIEKAGIRLKMEEVNDVNAFIKEGIKSVPTFKVNENLKLNFDKKMDIETFIHNAIQNILKEENFGDMPKIVVPTDFSESSKNALHYAYHLAHEQDKVIKLVHAYHPVSAEIDGYSVVDPHLENIKKKQLKKLCINTKEAEELGIEIPYIDEEFRIGFAADEVIDLSKDKTTDVIVMGSTGSGTTMKKLFGSVSLEVLKKAKAPVLIIPPSVKYKGIKNVLYATDNPMLDAPIIDNIVDFLAPFKITLHLINVHTDEKTRIEAENVKELYKDILDPQQLIYKELQGKDVAAVIDQYAEEVSIDMIVMTRKKKRIIDMILKGSVTSKMAINTATPLLVFHEGDKVCNCGGACKKIKKTNHAC